MTVHIVFGSKHTFSESNRDADGHPISSVGALDGVNAVEGQPLFNRASRIRMRSYQTIYLFLAEMLSISPKNVKILEGYRKNTSSPFVEGVACLCQVGEKLVELVLLETNSQIKQVVRWCGRFESPAFRNLYPRVFLGEIVPTPSKDQADHPENKDRAPKHLRSLTN